VGGRTPPSQPSRNPILDQKPSLTLRVHSHPITQPGRGSPDRSTPPPTPLRRALGVRRLTVDSVVTAQADYCGGVEGDSRLRCPPSPLLPPSPSAPLRSGRPDINPSEGSAPLFEFRLSLQMHGAPRMVQSLCSIVFEPVAHIAIPPSLVTDRRPCPPPWGDHFLFGSVILTGPSPPPNTDLDPPKGSGFFLRSVLGRDKGFNYVGWGRDHDGPTPPPREISSFSCRVPLSPPPYPPSLPPCPP